MIGLLASPLLKPILKYGAMVAVALFAYWYVWDTGRDHERAKWEDAMRAEQDRQVELLDAAREHGAALAAELEAAEVERSDLLRRMQDEARNAPNAGNACLDADSVMRLNSLGN